MKRLLILCAGLFLAVSAHAQMTAEDYEGMTPRQFRLYKFDRNWEDFPKFEVRAGYSGIPVMDLLNFGVIMDHDILPPDFGSRLDQIYQPKEGSTYMTGNFLAEFSWHMRKRFTLTGALFVNGIYSSLIDPDINEAIGHDRGVSLTFIPQARFSWATGDRFRPFGMRGSKLVSDYLTDRKKSIIEKRNQLVVVDAQGEIVWLVGERVASTCAVTPATTDILRMTYITK